MLIPMVCVLLYILGERENHQEFLKREENLHKKYYEEDIKKKFPKAYNAYWNKPDEANSVFKNYSNTILSYDSSAWTNAQWEILEKHLFTITDSNRENEDERKTNRARLILGIKNKYPIGYQEYKKLFPNSSDTDVLLSSTMISILDTEKRITIKKGTSSINKR